MVFSKWWKASPHDVGKWPVDEFRDALEFMDIRLDLEAEAQNNDPNKIKIGETPWDPSMMPKNNG